VGLVRNCQFNKSESSTTKRAVMQKHQNSKSEFSKKKQCSKSKLGKKHPHSERTGSAGNISSMRAIFSTKMISTVRASLVKKTISAVRASTVRNISGVRTGSVRNVSGVRTSLGRHLVPRNVFDLLVSPSVGVNLQTYKM
jgi:hypothetical protein